MALIKVCSEKDVPIGSIRQFEPNHRAVAIANINGKLYAINGHCPHMGGPLGEGELNGKTVTCPWHAAEFDVTTGKVLSPPATKDALCYAVKIENGDVFVDIT